MNTASIVKPLQRCHIAPLERRKAAPTSIDRIELRAVATGIVRTLNVAGLVPRRSRCDCQIPTAHPGPKRNGNGECKKTD